MRRREFISLLGGGVATWSAVRAQQLPRTLYRIGYLGTGTDNAQLQGAFLQGMRELGWIEGQNFAVDYRFAEGNQGTLPGLVDELVGLKVDVIVASPTPATMAAKSAAPGIPIVGIGIDNPIENGLIASLARPGGNVTGVSYSVGPDIFGKDLELLREVMPGVRLVGVISNSAGPNHQAMFDSVTVAARTLGMQLLLKEIRGPSEFDDAFDALAREQVGALFVFGDPMLGVHRARLAKLAVQHRLPAVYTNRLHVDAGGLMSYGPSFTDLWRRAAAYVDKVLKGAKPAELPVEQPTKFELVVNARTAKALGIALPSSLLARTDEVIE